jgi:Tfp pilus assembly protein PilV
MRKGGRSGERGTTLIEAMLATMVILIGFLGIMAVNKIGVFMNGNARSVTRASAIATDLVEQIGLWSYDDARLSTGTHAEADLVLGGATWSGIPTAVVRDGVPFTRTWSVTRVDDVDGNGIWDGARIAIDVTGGRSTVVLYTYKKNPAEM